MLGCMSSLGTRTKLAEEAEKTEVIKNLSSNNAIYGDSVNTEEEKSDKPYDAPAFERISDLLGDIGDSETERIIHIPYFVDPLDHTVETAAFQDSLAFFIGIGLIKMVDLDEFSVNLDKFRELRGMYLKHYGADPNAKVKLKK